MTIAIRNPAAAGSLMAIFWVRPAWATTRLRKTTTRSVVGSVNRKQG